ncbi:MAG: hypothetical protein ACFE9R_16575 [Candidatus Hermodarchaeota archaeon]
MFIGIKEGKIIDICDIIENRLYSRERWSLHEYTQELENKDKEIMYFKVPDSNLNDFVIDDTWNFETMTSNKDSIKRMPNLTKSTLEQKIDDLESRIQELEAKVPSETQK